MKTGLFAKIAGDELQESSVLGLASRTWKPDAGMLLGGGLGYGAGALASHLFPDTISPDAGRAVGGLAGGAAGLVTGSRMEANKFRDRAVQQGATPAQAEEVKDRATYSDLGPRLLAITLALTAMNHYHHQNNQLAADPTLAADPDQLKYEQAVNSLKGVGIAIPSLLSGPILAPSYVEKVTREMSESWKKKERK